MIKHVLILEDKTDVIERLRSAISQLVSERGDTADFQILTTQRGVQQYSHLTDKNWDLILLDYFAPDGNFHVLDIESAGPEKGVAISSAASKNQLAENRGVMYSVAKGLSVTDDTIQDIVECAGYILYPKENISSDE